MTIDNFPEKLLTYGDVQEITGIKSRVTLWKKSKDDNDTFPKAYKVGNHFTRWKLSEILNWMDHLETV